MTNEEMNTLLKHDIGLLADKLTALANDMWRDGIERGERVNTAVNVVNDATAVLRLDTPYMLSASITLQLTNTAQAEQYLEHIASINARGAQSEQGEELESTKTARAVKAKAK